MFGRKPTPQPKGSTSSQTPTFVAAGTQIHGDLKAKGPVRVDGVILGSMLIDGDLEIAPGGRVEGEEVRARNILVNGEVRAKIVADGKLTLTKRAHVEGDVVAKALDIEAGATFVGRSVTGDGKQLSPTITSETPPGGRTPPAKEE
ncbi:MAG TPA: polymer-forming cytoskeletal protein [Oceanithermus profundus]|uniref:Polymer-forming cytoskeletal protein n=1 Tax=Oceanithermus profundus TaxID=187137 RepID=A0A7C4V741_9DEIN|nr:polymer-forming cytoskeletal protein [Oceanithermus profundus]